MIWGLADKPRAGAKNRGGGGGVSQRGSSPAVGTRWGKGKREARATRRWSCRGRGRPGAGSAAEQRLTGGGERRRRRSSGSGRRGACRGSSADHEEASLGVDLSRGGAEQGAPRRPMEDRRPWRRQGCSGRREGARVAFWCARGKSGGVMVLLGAKEGGENSGRGGTRVAAGQRTAASSGAHRGVLGRLKRAKGGEGGGLGVGGARH